MSTSISVQKNADILSVMSLPDFRNDAFHDFVVSKANQVRDVILWWSETPNLMMQEIIELDDEQATQYIDNLNSNLTRICNSIWGQGPTGKSRPILINREYYVSYQQFMQALAKYDLCKLGYLDIENTTCTVTNYSNDQTSDINVTEFMDMLNSYKDGIFSLYGVGALSKVMFSDNLSESLSLFDIEIKSYIDSASQSAQTFINQLKQILADNFGNMSGIYSYIYKTMGFTSTSESLLTSDNPTLPDSDRDTLFSSSISSIQGYSGVAPGMVAVGGAALSVTGAFAAITLSGLVAVGKAVAALGRCIKQVCIKVKEVFVDPMDLCANDLVPNFSSRPSISDFSLCSKWLNTTTGENGFRDSYNPNEWTDWMTEGYDGSSFLIFDYWVCDRTEVMNPVWHRRKGCKAMYKMACTLYKVGKITIDPSRVDLTLSEQIQIESQFQNYIKLQYSSVPMFKTYFGEVAGKYNNGAVFSADQSFPKYNSYHSLIYEWAFRLFKDSDTQPDLNDESILVDGLIDRGPMFNLSLKPYIMNPEYFWQFFRLLYDSRTDYTGYTKFTHTITDYNSSSWTDQLSKLQELNNSWSDKWQSNVTDEKEGYLGLQCGVAGLMHVIRSGLYIGQEGDSINSYINDISWGGASTIQAEFQAWKTYVLNHMPSIVTNEMWVKTAAGYHLDGTTAFFSYPNMTMSSTFTCVPTPYGYSSSDMVYYLAVEITPHLYSLMTYQAKAGINGLFIPYRKNVSEFSPSAFRIRTDSENLTIAMHVAATIITVAAVAVAVAGITAACWQVAASIYAARSKKAISLWNKMSSGQSISGLDAFKYWRYNLAADASTSVIQGFTNNISTISKSISHEHDESTATSALINAVYQQLFNIIHG